MTQGTKIRMLLMTALLAALLAVCSQIIVPLGPVPFTLGLFGVFFAGAMLPPLYATACVGVYILLGVVGLPVFAGFLAGPQVLFGPTGGYLAGYFVLVLAMSAAIRYKLPPVLQMAVVLGGLALFYLLGTVWFMVWSGQGFVASLLACVVPFILPDIGKAALAFVLAKALQKRLAAGRMTV